MTRDDVFAELSAIHDRTVANDNGASAQYRAEIDQRREAILSEGLSYDELVSRLAEYDVQTAFIADRWRAEICAREQTQMLVHEILSFRKDRAAGGGSAQRRKYRISTAKAKEMVWAEWRSGEYRTKDDVAWAQYEDLGRAVETVRDWLKEPRACESAA